MIYLAFHRFVFGDSILLFLRAFIPRSLDGSANKYEHDPDYDIPRFLPTTVGAGETSGPNLQISLFLLGSEPSVVSHRMEGMWSHGISSLLP